MSCSELLAAHLLPAPPTAQVGLDLIYLAVAAFFGDLSDVEIAQHGERYFALI